MSLDDDRSAGHDDAFRVAEFALGLLDADAHREMAARIAADPDLLAELKFWQSRLSGLHKEYAPQKVPAGVYRRIENRVFGGPSRKGLFGFWHDTVLWRGLAAASVVVAGLAVTYTLMRPATVDPQQFAVQLVAALQAQEGSGIEFVALYDEASGMVRLTSLSGEVAPDHDLELWYIKGEEPAVSMGVIPMNARTEIEVPANARPKFGEGTIFALSLEQKGGSPTGKRQGPIVAVGSATQI